MANNDFRLPKPRLFKSNYELVASSNTERSQALYRLQLNRNKKPLKTK